ncbi:MAG: hypothetical protein KF729_10300 [Sandaracinaceae bacterium]|nr:hypothetical protein [Sandaracinaceae bacterium]
MRAAVWWTPRRPLGVGARAASLFLDAADATTVGWVPLPLGQCSQQRTLRLRADATVEALVAALGEPRSEGTGVRLELRR